MDVRVKRVYEPAERSDGYRILIDRLWPRGVSHERARLDAWERDLAPSAELRTWFGHRPDRFEEFRRRYLEELRQQRPRLSELRRRAPHGTVTLVFAARDTEHNDAVVLGEVIRRGLPRAPTGLDRLHIEQDVVVQQPRVVTPGPGNRSTRRRDDRPRKG
jgi:uncharacterized protein YeaO (DUF488 family)